MLCFDSIQKSFNQTFLIFSIFEGETPILLAATPAVKVGVETSISTSTGFPLESVYFTLNLNMI